LNYNSYNPSEGNVLVCSDAKVGSYEPITFKLQNGGGIQQVAGKGREVVVLVKLFLLRGIDLLFWVKVDKLILKILKMKLLKKLFLLLLLLMDYSLVGLRVECSEEVRVNYSSLNNNN